MKDLHCCSGIMNSDSILLKPCVLSVIYLGTQEMSNHSLDSLSRHPQYTTCNIFKEVGSDHSFWCDTTPNSASKSVHRRQNVLSEILRRSDLLLMPRSQLFHQASTFECFDWASCPKSFDMLCNCKHDTEWPCPKYSIKYARLNFSSERPVWNTSRFWATECILLCDHAPIIPSNISLRFLRVSVLSEVLHHSNQRTQNLTSDQVSVIQLAVQLLFVLLFPFLHLPISSTNERLFQNGLQSTLHFNIN